MNSEFDLHDQSTPVPPIDREHTERANAPFAPRRNVSGMAGWALVAILAVGAGFGTAAMVERPSDAVGTQDMANAMPRPGQNAGPANALNNSLPGIDTTLTTAGTRIGGAGNGGNSESIRLAVSSMQRQINALSSRNDRLEARIRQLQAAAGDTITTGSIPIDPTSPSENTSATSALQTLAVVENDNPSSSLATGLNTMRQQSQEISGIDLGSGISFAALRAKWMDIKAARPGELDSLEARAVLRDGSEGLIAHLIVGPLSNREAAARLCESIEPTGSSTCQAVRFEGQPL